MKKVLFAVVATMVCASALAIPGFLQSQTVNGSVKYCRYSNGVILTVGIIDLCPLSAE